MLRHHETQRERMNTRKKKSQSLHDSQPQFHAKHWYILSYFPAAMIRHALKRAMAFSKPGGTGNEREQKQQQRGAKEARAPPGPTLCLSSGGGGGFSLRVANR